jgi:hypothetical protein
MSKSKSILAWHFLPEDRRLQYGDNRLVAAGRRHTVKGEIALCEHGLHASIKPLDAMEYAPSATVQRVKLSGTIIHGDDKLVASARTCLWIADAAPVLHEFACWCAEQALALIDNPDPRSVAAIEAKRKWLHGEITDDDLAAAGDAAGDAAWDAAGDAALDAALDAARAAAGDAAWDAARAAARAAAGDAAWDAARAAARADQNAKLEELLLALGEAIGSEAQS